MDSALRCNSLKCRTKLEQRAVVTTCSHIFCVSCAESLGLAGSNASARTCPACQAHVPNDDDVVVTELNPSEDYKTSVLSGLSPSTIMECAGRGIAFYTYQIQQEIAYQELLARSLTEKYTTLSSQMDKVIHDANSEISNLRGNLEALQLERQNLEVKNQELANHFREKSKKHQKLQQAYQSLKQKSLAAGIEVAADQNAEHAIQAAAAGNFNTHHNRNAQPMPSRNGSYASGGSGGRRQNVHVWTNQAQGTRLNSAQSAPVPATPSGHRTQLHNLYNNRAQNVAGLDSYQQPTPRRTAFNNIDPNIHRTNNTSYGGMSAGVKVPRQYDGSINRNGGGMERPSGVSGLNNH